jgi:hypothetical protein
MGMSEKRPKSPSVEVRFNSIKQGEERPNLALYSLDESGRVAKKLSVLEADRLVIPSEALEEGTSIALGPNVHNPEALPAEAVVQYRAEQVASWQQAGVLELPRGVWSGFRFPNVCVSGMVEKCSLGVFQATHFSINPILRLPLPQVCAPLCNGVVEIYEQLCCCRWWIDPIDIDSLLDKLKHLVAVQPPIPRPGPGPDPLEMIALRNEVALMRATTGAGPQQVMLAVPHFDPAAEYVKVKSMPKEEAMAYVRQSEILRPFCCDCTMRKVGEAVLNEDGTFSFCYYRAPIYYTLGSSCGYRYAYKVKQWNGTSWSYVYDGVSAGQTFPQDQSAKLETFWGNACDPGSPIDHPGVYVMLENIGDTQSWNLVSQTQTGELHLAAVAANGGLVFPPAPMTSDLGVFRNCPWGETLPLRLRFHKDLISTTGAKYYRISVYPTNDGRTPSGPPTVLKAPVAWSYFFGSPVSVGTQTLGPNTVGGIDGLYLIPDPVTDWEWYQFHNYFDTTQFANGRYLLSVEIYDSSATPVRLKPNGSPGTGTAKPFVFVKWNDATTTSDVVFPDLVHLFWIDNTYVYGHIDDLRLNGVASSSECQYMTGSCGDLFSIGYRAFHATVNSGSPPETFMYYYDISWKRGLGTGWGWILAPPPTGNGTTNVPVTLGGGSPQQSPGVDICTMLGVSSGQHKKCSFAVNLNVYAKHFNGVGRIGYDAYDEAAFSLEV